jgi:hypothetical protein
MAGKVTILSLCILSILVLSFVVPPVSAQFSAIAIDQFEQKLAQSKPGYRMASRDYEEEGDRCLEKCKMYSDKLTNHWITIFPSIDPEVTSLMDFTNYWCKEAEYNYGMALKLSPDEDLLVKARIYDNVSKMYGYTKQENYSTWAGDKAEEYRDTAEMESDFSIPLSPIISLIAIVLSMVIFIKKKR